MIATWPAPRGDSTSRQELLVAFARERAVRVLVLAALFEEANKLRRFTLEVMRALDRLDIDTFLPDLPGCNESLAPLADQTLTGWREAAAAAAQAVGATHVLAIRAGALLAPAGLPGWHYAPQSGARTLRGMIRARTIAAREAGREESSEQLAQIGRADGITLAGWTLGPELFRELEQADSAAPHGCAVIAQTELGGPGLWLRAEPGEDRAQAEALAAMIATGRDRA